MLDNKICTVEELKNYMQKNMSQKRFLHSVGVAETTEKILNRYDCKIAEQKFGLFDAGTFCGLSHDLAREMPKNEIVNYCRLHNIVLDDENKKFPVLAHGLVSADLAKRLCGNYPESWQRAISVHTTGCANMDDLALALFVADFIEPNRTFLDDEKRKYYLDFPTIFLCAYAVLCDMISHWKEKPNFAISEKSFLMKRFLEEHI